MSDWRLKRGPGSFRGVPFFVESTEQAGGRHVVADEVPFSNEPASTQDLGLKGRTISLECFVIGTEYEKARDDLVRALELPGPGEIVHPHVGVRRVAIVSFRMRQDRAGGIARFSIEVRESRGEAPRPLVTSDARAVAGVRLTAFKSAADSQFAAARSVPASFSGATPPGDAVVIQSMALAMIRTLAALPIPAATRAGFERVVTSDFDAGNLGLVGFLTAGVGWVIDAFEVAVNAAAELVGDPVATILAAVGVYGTRPLGSAPTALQAQADFDALQTLIEARTLAAAASTLLAREFTDYDSAVNARDLVAAALDDLADRTRDLGVYPALAPLRAALVDAVPGADRSLPRLQPYTVAIPTPSLVVAHRLYGDLDREGDLVARNRVRHPGFVHGSIEVLSDG